MVGPVGHIRDFRWLIDSLRAEAWDTAGQRRSHTITVDVGIKSAGQLVGNYGSDGYALFAWTASTDLVLLPSASLAIEQGRAARAGVVSDVRALESPDESQRRAGAVSTPNQVRLDSTTSQPPTRARRTSMPSTGSPPPVVSASPSMTARAPASPR